VGWVQRVIEGGIGAYLFIGLSLALGKQPQSKLGGPFIPARSGLAVGRDLDMVLNGGKSVLNRPRQRSASFGEDVGEI
jgi:hypothetical protein